MLEGRIPACKWVKLACERQQRDLSKQGQPDWLYVFDERKAERICRYMSLLPHIKGPKAKRGEKLVLDPWQCFILTTIAGWVHKETGLRRFRQVYEEVARGNGKSTKLAGVSLYFLTEDGEAGAEVYSAATTRKQAKFVWETAKYMVDRTPALRDKYGLSIFSTSLSVEKTASRFEALSSEAGNLDGANIHFVSIDELHAHRTREVYDVLETGMGKRDQPMMFIITTAGTDRAGICYEIRTYATKVLQGLITDEAFFGIIYTLDDDDEWTDEACWIKANPGWNSSIDKEEVRRLGQKAMQLPSAQNNFRTKHLNQWMNADTAWMDMRALERCKDVTLSIEQFLKDSCYGGLDLASKVDLAAKARLFTRQIDGAWHFYYFGSYYLPEDAITDARNSQYEGWERMGRVTTTPGDTIDYSIIEDELIEDNSRLDDREWAYDPWQATQLAQRMEKKGLKMIEFRQTVQNMSEPMKELEAIIRQGRFHYDGDPVIEWMFSNVVCHFDKKDNIYPNKERPENKIDGVVALIMALGRAMIMVNQPKKKPGFVIR